MTSLAQIIERMRSALAELADAAEGDMLINKMESEVEPGGWWSQRTEEAIARARAALSDYEGKADV